MLLQKKQMILPNKELKLVEYFEEIAAERGIDISGLNIVEKGISERGYAGDLEGYADYDPELKGDGYLGQRGFGFDYTATTPDSRKAYLETPPPPPLLHQTQN